MTASRDNGRWQACAHIGRIGPRHLAVGGSGLFRADAPVEFSDVGGVQGVAAGKMERERRGVHLPPVGRNDRIMGTAHRCLREQGMDWAPHTFFHWTCGHCLDMRGDGGHARNCRSHRTRGQNSPLVRQAIEVGAPLMTIGLARARAICKLSSSNARTIS